MSRILVSGASGVVGYGILRSLKMSSADHTRIGASIYEDSVAQGFCEIFETAPKTDAPGYLEWLLALIKKHQVDLIVPGIEIDLYKWVENLEALSNAGAKVVMNNPALVRLSKDKWLFYEQLKAKGLECAIPTFTEGDFNSLKAKCGLPFLLKPRQGFGSKGIFRINSQEEFIPMPVPSARY
jgi:carbamoyl-phosphate synthase large subunit